MKNIATALSTFEEYSIKHTEGLLSDDYKQTNSYYKYIIASVNYLKKEGEFNLLLPLLLHDNEGVRVWAATYLLPTNEDQAKTVLKKISQKSSLYSPNIRANIIASNAKYVLIEWEKGSLKV